MLITLYGSLWTQLVVMPLSWPSRDHAYCPQPDRPLTTSDCLKIERDPAKTHMRTWNTARYFTPGARRSCQADAYATWSNRQPKPGSDIF